MVVLPQVQPMFVSSTYRITLLHYTFRCPTLGAAYVCQLYLQNDWIILLLWVRHLKKEPLLVGSTFSMTALRYSFGCATVSGASFCKLCLRNHRVTLHLWVSNLKCSLCLLALPTKSLGYTTLIGAPPWVQPLLVSSAFTNTRLHYTYRCPTLSEAYVCRVLLHNKWVRVHL